MDWPDEAREPRIDPALGRGWSEVALPPVAGRGFVSVRAVAALGSGDIVAVGWSHSGNPADHATPLEAVVWRSSDGLAWREVPGAGASFGKGAAPHELVAVAGRLVALGTKRTEPGRSPVPFAWSSVDAQRWEPLSLPGAPEDTVVTGAASDGRRAVVVGHSPAGPAGWQTTDGLGWSETPWAGDGHVADVAFIPGGPGRLVAVGTAVWQLSPSAGWERVDAPELRGGGFASVRSLEDGAQVVGSVRASTAECAERSTDSSVAGGCFRPVVWRSAADMTRWRRYQLPVEAVPPVTDVAAATVHGLLSPAGKKGLSLISRSFVGSARVPLPPGILDQDETALGATTLADGTVLFVGERRMELVEVPGGLPFHRYVPVAWVWRNGA